MSIAVNPGIADSDTRITVVSVTACPICGRTGNVLYRDLTDWTCGIPGTWSLRSCQCGILWLDPRPRDQDLPKLYSRYYTHQAGADAGRLELIRREILKCVLARLGYNVEPSRSFLPRLLSLVPSIARARELQVMGLRASQRGALLDVGCGNGDFIEQMRTLGWHVSGVDPDPSAVSYGLTKGLEMFTGTVSDIPAQSRFQVITLSHVIEHVSDPVALLRECGKRLSPGGRIVITTPNIRSLGHRWFRSHWRGLEIPRHLHVFSPASLKQYIQRAGLQVQFLCTETRMARSIHNTSSYARRGLRGVTERSQFDNGTKLFGYLFRVLENLLNFFQRDVGEEILCVCAR